MRRVLLACGIGLTALLGISVYLIASNLQEPNEQERAGVSRSTAPCSKLPPGEAPLTYEQIQQARGDIADDNEPGLSDEQFTKLKAYEVKLRGRVLCDWQGYVQVIMPDAKQCEELVQDGFDNTDITVVITLDPPEDGASRLSGPRTANIADLTDVKIEDARELAVWQDNTSSIWQPVTFNGNIVDVELGANVRLWLNNVELQASR